MAGWVRGGVFAACVIWPLLLGSSFSYAQSADPQTSFNQIAGSIRDEAARKGVSEKTLNLVFTGLSPVKGLAALEKMQPEHKPGNAATPQEMKADFNRYIGKFITPSNVEKGQAILAQNKTALKIIHENYPGLPAQIILAIFGVETRYGEMTGSYKVIPSLITLARDGRTSDRRAMFRAEAITALQIADHGNKQILTKPGSHMGAFGIPQFMPSSYQRHAIDGDGDGHKDIWSNWPDAIASTANYLTQKGWKAEDRWGAEVRIPAGFDKNLYTDNRRPGNQRIKTSAEWSNLGITLTDGSPLPINDNDRARIIEPGGPLGPHYIVYDNFMGPLMDYNSSYKYVLSVVLLADKIAGGKSSTMQSPMNP